jgi:hypothetical protein
VNLPNVQYPNVILNCIYLAIVDPRKSAKVALGMGLLSYDSDRIFAQIFRDNSSIVGFIPVFSWRLLASVDDCVLLRLGEVRL